MMKPEKMPFPVSQAIGIWIMRHFREASVAERTSEHVKLLADITWDSMNGCYYFVRNGMYHGVETDGHIHT